MAEATHYDVLGVQPTDDPSVLRRAYLAQARRYHPDFHVGGDEKVRRMSEERMRALNQAWHVLSNQARRARYDRELEAQPRTSPSAPESPRRSETPRWVTIAPLICLVLAVALFSVGVVTDLVALLAAGVATAILGAALFAIAPLVVLNRPKRG